MAGSKRNATGRAETRSRGLYGLPSELKRRPHKFVRRLLAAATASSDTTVKADKARSDSVEVQNREATDARWTQRRDGMRNEMKRRPDDWA